MAMPTSSATKAALAGGRAPPPLSNHHWQVDFWPISKLWQPDKAPRRYSKKEIAKAESIMRRFGIRLPIVIASSGKVIAHFLAVIAARNLGYDEMPVVLADDLSVIKQDALSVALARLYELGKFDEQLLGELLIEIETHAPEIDFGYLGLEGAEADRAIGKFRGDGDPEPVINHAGPAITQLGDIWICGKHRIGCGDAGSLEWLQRVMAGAQAAMAFADYPYGCKVGGFVTSRSHREFVQGSGQESSDELAHLFHAWCEGIRSSCRPGALVYLCIDWRSLGMLMAVAKAVFGELLNLIVWAKERAGMGSFYRSQHELILLFRVPGAEHQNNVQLGRHGRNRSNLWSYASAVGFGASGTEGDLLADHPTPKNKEMIADAMLDCTKRGEVVLDPFLGSGSTLIAAEKVGRTFRGSDLDPLYVDLAVRRWQAWTGRQAVHAETGRLFDDLARERSDLAVAEKDLNNE